MRNNIFTFSEMRRKSKKFEDFTTPYIVTLHEYCYCYMSNKLRDEYRFSFCQGDFHLFSSFDADMIFRVASK